MITRVSLLFQVTTSPLDRTSASPHSGGWSEQFYINGQLASGSESIRTLAQSRAAILPSEAACIGARFAYYNINANKLFPSGTATVKFQFRGNPNYTTDLPQVALEMSGSTLSGPNTSRFRLRCIPDSVMVGGEFQPDASFRRLLTVYSNNLSNFNNLGFIGRNLSLPSARVLSIAGNTVTLDGSIGAVLGTDYMRFNRVLDITGVPVQGVYRIVNFAAPGTYTVAGLEQRTAGPNGTARVDQLSFFDYSTIVPVRAVVKKVGRPFENYRGRASKRRV